MSKSFWYLLGEFFSKIVPFLLLPYFTNSLGTSGYGNLIYYLAIIAIAKVIISFGLETTISRCFFRYGKNTAIIMLKTHFLFTSSIVFCISVICIYLNKYIELYILIAAYSQAIFFGCLVFYQCQERASKYIFFQASATLLSIIFTVILFDYFDFKAEYRILSLCLSYLIFSIIVYMNIIGVFFHFKFHKTHFYYLIVSGFPLLLHQLSFVIKGQFDRFLIFDKFSSSELGSYGLAFQLASIITLILQAIYKGIMPKYYDRLKKQQILKKTIIRFSIYSVIPLFFLSFFPLIIPKDVYQFFFGSEFYNIPIIMSFFMISMIFYGAYLILSGYLFYYNDNSYIAKINVLSIPIYLILVLVLSNYKIYLIPLSMMISNLFVFILLLIRVRAFSFSPKAF
ncbi:oligosaccharide flippase family protein [Providencia rettgeri]|uniref:oligosaccharide flippase family protein n=1 Tax=Providencia rettgeri TaxID=587 RepID=UPI00065E42D7|nr:oligosaccharide flippase family protein [Providencia rettgeri]